MTADGETVAARPHAIHGPRTTTITSSADALLRDELDRSRRLGLTGMCLPPVTIALLPVLGGDATARAVLVVSLVAFMIGNAAIYYCARDVRRWTARNVGAAWAVATLALLGVTYYFGLYSGALVALVLGIYVGALSRDPRIAVVVYATTAVGHAGLIALLLGGVIDDRGVISTAGIASGVRLAGEVLLQVTFAAAFQMARASQRTTRDAVMELERAARTIAVREAMLLEVRADFDRAARGGGRYTDQVIGSFRLGAVLGRGGMGEVYEATRVDGGEPAAVKVLHVDRLGERDVLARFQREVEISSALRSRHVVRVLEVGDDATPVPYFAMELLRGVDLGGWLRERGRLPLDEVVELVRQVALGLDDARRAGIVHRDLKPQNLFRADEVGRTGPTWKVLDFGVSKLAGHGGTLTQGFVVGTPQYMAPEQAAGDDVDHRADVYSLAAIAFRCLTGRPPFAGADAPALLYQVVHTAPPRASDLVALPASVDDVLARGLSKRPEDRPATAPALAEALAAAAVHDDVR